jgi:stringent starvation protein B
LFETRTKERKFPTRHLKAAAAREEGEDISLKDDHQYQQRRRDDKLRSSGERIHVAVRSHETIHERRRRRRVGIVAVLL